ncbi:hypothetical protein AABB02_40425 [Streptomyces rimosus]
MSPALLGVVLILVWVLVSGALPAPWTWAAVGMSLPGAQPFLRHLRVHRT